MRKRILLCLALMVGIISEPSASAHTVLVGSIPAAGTTISHLPESIRLTFADPLLTFGNVSVNEVQVIDPMGMTITTSKNVVTGAVLSNVLNPSMVMIGTYHVVFHVAAQDGHVLNGSFEFRIGKTVQKMPATNVPKSGIVRLHAYANGEGVYKDIGSPTDTALGVFIINFSNYTFCYSIKTRIKGITAAHIHSVSQQNLTVSDEIYLPLLLASVNARTPICQKEDGKSLATISQNSRGYVLMLHTTKYPNGDVAGILVK